MLKLNSNINRIASKKTKKLRMKDRRFHLEKYLRIAIKK